MNNDLEQLINEGLTQREIANRLGISQTTVRYRLSRSGLKTQHNRYRKKHEGDTRYIQSECVKHGLTEFIFEKSKNGYRCKRCRSGNVTEQRRLLKSEAVKFLGGKCRCGYNKSIAALDFHHRDPMSKTYNIGDLIARRKRKELFEELEKCILLCANCHREEEERKWFLA